ncbi:histidinol-phosphatase HisJ [Domibacillus iocasae]|uniref:Histidinol-phosphatase n=1 Tax=Domibacillus iocasae TaxID=1714016 RepID=A0A1E7DMA2_9BACI|nr:histidinol-phosphatase HisJ [Domibacillus iocasae]OES44135.1 histidinol phosphatase [Domibacillus iocasae]
MLRDGHIHTLYCPHGSNDSLKQYIERAIELGFSELTFTEHAPLPETFIDPAPARDSSMRKTDLEQYLKALESVKKQYASSLKINAGLEVDFISGFEEETTQFLAEYGSFLDDSILSVHFLPLNGQFVCIDFSEEEFGRITQEAGSIEFVYELYYDTVLQSIQADLGAFKPSRIGHITLVRKFQHMFHCTKSFDLHIERILQAVKRAGYSLDYNGAGFVKPLCRETYPPVHIARAAHSLGIPLIYGSDAHAAAGIGQGLEQIDRTLIEGSV